MHTAAAVLGLTVSLMSGSVAIAANEGVLREQKAFENAVRLTVHGLSNVLLLDQQATGGLGTNAIRVGITGDGNGGAAGATFSANIGSGGVHPGQLVQSGLGNAIDLDIVGDKNLFAVSQQGNYNVIHGVVEGFQNQVQVAQAGNNNFASFTQRGIGNSIIVSQLSW